MERERERQSQRHREEDRARRTDKKIHQETQQLADSQRNGEGRQGGNNNPWFRLSYTGKDTFLVGSHAKKEKKTHLQLCTDSIM